MDTVVNLVPKPSDLVISGIMEGPLVAVKKKCCSCFSDDKFSRASQVVSVAIAVSALAAIILMSLHLAPLTTETYAFCVVLIIVCSQNAYSLQRNIELGGYEKQNTIFARNNLALAAKIDELDPIARSLSVSLLTAKELNDQQVVQIQSLQSTLLQFQDENNKLMGAVTKYEQLLGSFEQSIQKHAKKFDSEVAALAAGAGRLELIETKFGSLLEATNKVMDVYTSHIDRLERTQAGLQGVLAAMNSTSDLHEFYLHKEMELQTAREVIAKEEKVLLKQLSDEAEKQESLTAELRIISENFKAKRSHCATLCVTVFRLQVAEGQLTDMLNFIKDRNRTLYDDSRVCVLENHKARIRAFRERHSAV